MVVGSKALDTASGQWSGLMELLTKVYGATAVQQSKELLNIPMGTNIKGVGLKI